MKEQDIIEVVAALIEEGGRYLVGLRPAGKAQAGLWEFVGGKIEPGETPEAALVRECKEELGAEIACGKELESLVYSYPGKTIRLTLLEARILPGSKAAAKEHKSIAWKSLGEMRTLDFAPADRILFERISGKI